MAQLVKRPTSPKVMISQFVSLSPEPGSVLTVQSLEPASDSVSISLPFSCLHTVSLSLSNINKHLKSIQKESKLGRLGGSVG